MIKILPLLLILLMCPGCLFTGSLGHAGVIETDIASPARGIYVTENHTILILAEFIDSDQSPGDERMRVIVVDAAEMQPGVDLDRFGWLDVSSAGGGRNRGEIWPRERALPGVTRLQIEMEFGPGRWVDFQVNADHKNVVYFRAPVGGVERQIKAHIYPSWRDAKSAGVTRALLFVPAVLVDIVTFPLQLYLLSQL